MEITTINANSETTFFEELPFTEPYVVLTKDGTINYMNLSFSKNFGLNINQNISMLTASPDIASIYQQFYEANYTDFNFDVSVFVNSVDDMEPFNVDLKKVNIANSVYVIAMFTSIKSRMSLEENINNLFSAIDSSSLNVVIIDNKGLLKFISKSFEVVLNKKIERVFKQPVVKVLEEFLTPKESENFVSAIDEGKEWTKLIKIDNDGASPQYLELSLKPIFSTLHPENNFLLVAYDITSHVEQGRIIKLAEERQRRIIENISDLLLIIRKENGSLYFEGANENFLNVFPYSMKLSKHALLKEIVPADLRTKLLNALENNLNDNFRYTEPRTKREYIGRVSSVDDIYEKFKYYIVAFTDISENIKTEKKLRQAYEKENQLSKLKSTFLSNMSHEIRTPLNAIMGYIELMKDDIESHEYEYLPELLTNLRDGSNRLLNLVNNIIDISRLMSGENDVDLYTVELNAITNKVFQNFQPKAEQAGLKAKIIQCEKKLFVEGNIERFEKVLYELLDNAVKFNKPNGAIVLRTAIEVNEAVISVEDTGIGIDDNKINSVLAPFTQQEEEGYVRNYEGAGLGLALVDKITRLMNGKLSIQSELNSGTIVKIRFKLKTGAIN